jgi:hypothetical protein
MDQVFTRNKALQPTVKKVSILVWENDEKIFSDN